MIRYRVAARRVVEALFEVEVFEIDLIDADDFDAAALDLAQSVAATQVEAMAPSEWETVDETVTVERVG